MEDSNAVEALPPQNRSSTGNLQRTPFSQRRRYCSRNANDQEGVRLGGEPSGLRGDSGFGVPAMYEACERLGLWYTFGIGMNPRLKRESEELLDRAVEQYEQSGEKQRLFTALSYQANGWSRARAVVIKAECHAAGVNRRAVVTNRAGR